MSTSGAPPPPPPAPPAPPSSSSSSSSSSAPLVTASRKCFNSNCTDFKSRRGWRLRSGDFAELCDRCATAYEQGKYCEFFHLHAMGWRCCESCGKRIHCGCIVSMHAFMVLDAGGIECIGCARKNSVPMSNPSWQTSMFYHGPLSERVKDFSVKSWSPLSGSGPVPFRQTATLFNGSTPHQELHQRLNGSETLSTSSLDNVYLKLGKRDIHENGIAGTNSKEQHGSCPSAYEMSSRDEPSTPPFGATVPNGSTIEANQKVVRPWNSLWPTPPPSLAKQLHASTDAQIRNVRPRVDVRGRSQLSRYCPRITDEELQQISGNSNSTITPLFEKMLSASDAGKIGRLVLPKKCAEAYLPPISQPEGLPLKVQDSKGKEWVFQFRFWPNNNSRMYVLEGITPCIQNMKLQAGDIVTFSRLEPEGKLVMGFRKASTAASSDQDNTSKNGNRDSTSDANIIKPHAGEVTHLKDALESHGFPSINQELTDPNSSPWSKVDKSGYIAKEFIQAKSLTKRRKSSTLGSKSKRLRIENEDMIELKLTWEEAQGLLHPHPDNVPIVVEIEGFEFEEYEDAPVLGKPTILSSNNGGSLCSAVEDQQEDLLPSSDRAASKKGNTAKQGKRNVGAMQGLDTLANAAISGEHDQRLASPQATTRHPRHRPGCSCIVCIQPPSGAKHKQSCTCNVCQTVKRRFKTMMMKREKKQSDKDAETTANNQQQPLPESLVVGEPLSIDDAGTSNANNQKVVSVGSDDDSNRTRSSTSPFKGQIDLNMQPERDEELSPGAEPGSMMKMLQDATDRCLKQQRLSSTDGDRTSTGNQILEGTQGMVENNGNKSSHQDPGKDHPARFS